MNFIFEYEVVKFPTDCLRSSHLLSSEGNREVVNGPLDVLVLEQNLTLKKTNSYKCSKYLK